MKRPALPFFLLFVLLTILLLGFRLVSDGMFSDGMLYAAISKNIAVGEGSLWFPRVSDFYENPFRAHPFLGFGMQAIFYKVFGTAFWVERLYNFLLAILTGYLIVKIWQRAGGSLRTAFVPLLFWMSTEHVPMDFGNNMLENPLALWCLLCVYWQIRTLETGRIGYTVGAGIALLAAVLTKGPAGLFPLATFGLFVLVVHRREPTLWWKRAILPSIVLLLSGAMAFGLLVLFQPDALVSLTEYFDYQLRGTFGREHERVYTSSTWHLPRRLFEQMIPTLILAIAGWTYLYFQKIKLSTPRKQWAWFFLGLGISASAPLMLSPYQVTYYLMPSVPFYAIAIGLSIYPAVQKMLEFFGKKPTLTAGLSWFFVIGILICLFVAVGKWGEPVAGKHRAPLLDVATLNQYYPEPTVFGADSLLFNDAGLQAYLARYTEVQLDSVDCKEWKMIPVNETGATSSSMRRFRGFELVRCE